MLRKTEKNAKKVLSVPGRAGGLFPGGEFETEGGQVAGWAADGITFRI